tara:strand:- start:1392 stop:1877 length:486 start_codon:yes stop_codon:yes gene_type:complete
MSPEAWGPAAFLPANAAGPNKGKPMSVSTILNPNDPAFERFLYASVGEDWAGSTVSVLSVLARLNLDPWAEAADLAALGREASRTRLSLLLARSYDVPLLGRDHQAIADDLTRLLPAHAVGGGRLEGPPTGLTVSWGTLLAVMAFVVLFVQAVVRGIGAGD